MLLSFVAFYAKLATISGGPLPKMASPRCRPATASKTKMGICATMQGSIKPWTAKRQTPDMVETIEARAAGAKDARAHDPSPSKMEGCLRGLFEPLAALNGRTPDPRRQSIEFAGPPF